MMTTLEGRMGKIYRPKRPYEANEKKTYKEILIISHPRVRNFSYTYTLGIGGRGGVMVPGERVFWVF